MAEDLPGINIPITADYSNLQDALTAAESLAASKGKSIADAIGEAYQAGATNITEALRQILTATETMESGVESSFGNTKGVIAGWVEEVNAVQGATSTATTAIESLGDAATTAGGQVDAAKGQIQEAGSASRDASGGTGELLQSLLAFGGISVTVSALRDFVTAGSEIAAQNERTQKSLEIMTGSAQGAADTMEELKGIAQSLAVPVDALESMTQKLTAFGADMGTIRGAIQATADTAAATGNDFEAAATKIENIGLSGIVSSRNLVALGLNMQDLAGVMEVSVDDVKKAFADETIDQRIETLTEAIGVKFPDAAKQMVDTTSGQLQIAANSWRDLKENVGNAINPIIIEILPALGEAVKGLLAIGTTVVTGLKEVIDVVVGMFSTVSAAIDGYVGAIVKAVSGDFKGALQSMQDGWGNVKSASQATWDSLKKDVSDGVTAIDKLYGDQSKAAAETSKVAKQSAADAAAAALAMGQAVEDVAVQLEKATHKLIDFDDAALVAKGYADDVTAAHKRWQQTLIDLYEQMGRIPTQQEIINEVNQKAIEKIDSMRSSIDKMVDSSKALTAELKNTATAIEPITHVDLTPTQQMMKDLGINVLSVKNNAEAALSALRTLDSDPNASLPAIRATLQKIHTGFGDLSASDIPTFLSLIDQLEEKMASQGASAGEILDLEKLKWEAAENAAANAGEKTADYQIKIQEVQRAQEDLRNSNSVWDDIRVKLDATKTSVGELKDKIATDLVKAYQDAFTGFSKGLADLIVDGGKFGDVMTGIFKNIAKTILEDLIRDALKPLEDFLGSMLSGVIKNFGSALGNLIGLGAQAGSTAAATAGDLGKLGTAAGGAATSVGSAGSAAGGLASAAGTAASGILGVAGAIGGVVTAISSVISNFQNISMSTDLGHIEENTRIAAIHLRDFISPDIHNELYHVGSGVWYVLEHVTNAENVLNDLDAAVHTFVDGASASTLNDSIAALGQTVIAIQSANQPLLQQIADKTWSIDETARGMLADLDTIASIKFTSATGQATTASPIPPSWGVFLDDTASNTGLTVTRLDTLTQHLDDFRSSTQASHTAIADRVTDVKGAVGIVNSTLQSTNADLLGFKDKWLADYASGNAAVVKDLDAISADDKAALAELQKISKGVDPHDSGVLGVLEKIRDFLGGGILSGLGDITKGIGGIASGVGGLLGGLVSSGDLGHIEENTRVSAIVLRDQIWPAIRDELYHVGDGVWYGLEHLVNIENILGDLNDAFHSYAAGGQASDLTDGIKALGDAVKALPQDIADAIKAANTESGNVAAEGGPVTALDLWRQIADKTWSMNEYLAAILQDTDILASGVSGTSSAGSTVPGSVVQPPGTSPGSSSSAAAQQTATNTGTTNEILKQTQTAIDYIPVAYMQATIDASQKIIDGLTPQIKQLQDSFVSLRDSGDLNSAFQIQKQLEPLLQQQHTASEAINMAQIQAEAFKSAYGTPATVADFDRIIAGIQPQLQYAINNGNKPLIDQIQSQLTYLQAQRDALIAAGASANVTATSAVKTASNTEDASNQLVSVNAKLKDQQTAIEDTKNKIASAIQSGDQQSVNALNEVLAVQRQQQQALLNQKAELEASATAAATTAVNTAKTSAAVDTVNATIAAKNAELQAAIISGNDVLANGLRDQITSLNAMKDALPAAVAAGQDAVVAGLMAIAAAIAAIQPSITNNNYYNTSTYSSTISNYAGNPGTGIGAAGTETNPGSVGGGSGAAGGRRFAVGGYDPVGGMAYLEPGEYVLTPEELSSLTAHPLTRLHEKMTLPVPQMASGIARVPTVPMSQPLPNPSGAYPASGGAGIQVDKVIIYEAKDPRNTVREMQRFFGRLSPKIAPYSA